MHARDPCVWVVTRISRIYIIWFEFLPFAYQLAKRALEPGALPWAESSIRIDYLTGESSWGSLQAAVRVEDSR